MKLSASISIRYFTLLAFLFMSKLLLSQDPIIVSITLLPPYPNFAYEVIDMGDQSIITLQNTDFNNAHSIKLGVELTGTNGIIVRSKENALPNQPINLGAGESLVLTGEDLSGFYNNYTESDFDFIGITMEEVLNDQQLPDGLYTLCLRAYDYNSGFPLSSSAPSGCAPPFVVVAVDPPIITYPQSDLDVEPTEPQLMNINWIPVSISLPDLRYRMEIVELTDLPVNPYDAFLTGDFLFFYEDDIISNTFFYGMEFPLLEVGHEYAVRVRAYLLDGLLNVSNGGYSDIVTFTYGDNSDDDQDSISTVGLTTLPDANLNCGSDCIFLLTGSETSGSEDPLAGDTLDFGHYQMFVSTIEGGVGNYSGTGIIQATPYIPVGLKVEFENVRVDNSGRVFQGQAKASIRENSWIDHTWADIQTFTDDLNINNYNQLYTAAKNADEHIDNLQQQVGTSIPISIGDQSTSLQIVGINFFPDRASFNLSYIQKLADDPTGDRYLHFMAKDLCITPGGPSLSEDEAKLDLVKPLRYTFDNSTILTFQPVAAMQDGSYLSFDCNGFNGIYASGDIRFSTDVFKPVNKNGIVQQNDTLVATFRTSFIDWSDWVAFVSFDTDQESTTDPQTENLFIYKELEDYIIRVENAFFDHSINSNPSTMAFPENYNAVSGPEWQGFYIESLRIDLPKWVKVYGDSGKRIQLTGSNLLVDSEGLTGLIRASNVMVSKDGAMGKWPLTIDSLSIEIQQNELQQAYFKGGLKIPIIDEPFDYTADIQFLEDKTSHIFTFNPIDSYTFSSWYAESTFNNNSYLEVNIGTVNTFVEANLHGTISFAPIIGDIDKMNLTDITFENMIIRSAKNPKYIEFGEIGTNLSLQTLAVAGFGILLETLDWDENTLDNTGLVVGIGLDLAGGLNSISGGTELFIKNKIESYVDSISFDYEGITINDIYLEVETGAVNLKGGISFFRDDAKFGNGFEGNIELGFLKSIKIDGTVLFGNKEISGDDINYWYAFAMVYLPNTPAPMATPLDIYGFGGGVYYNMAVNQEFPNPAAIGGSLVDPKEAFIVSPGILGLQASVVTALTPSSRTFNADVTLTAEINLNTGGLNMIALTGAGYVMQELDEPNKEEAMVTATVAIMYDFPQETLTANMTLSGNIPKENPLLDISGEIDFYRSPDLWYFKAGIPTSKLTTTIDLGVAGINAGAYFMTGMQLDAPVLPTEVNAFFNFESNMVNNMQNGLGIGFMGGVHLDVNVDLTTLGTGIEINALAGVDIAVLNYFAATCNGSEDFGVNKWYAQGMGYIYGSFVLEAFTADVGSLELGIVLEGAFPNPTGVSGLVKAKMEFLIFEHDVEESFEMGSFCDIQPMENAEELIERKELELENMDLIGVITPANGETNISTTARPTIQWHKEHLSLKEYVYGDGMGGIIDKLYRFKNTSKWFKQNDSGDAWNPIDYSKDTDETDNITTFLAENSSGNPALLYGNAVYKIRAKSVIEYFDGDPDSYFDSPSSTSYLWGPANYLEGSNQGDPIEEIKEHLFTTKSNLTEIEQFHVDYTLPYPRQRYYPYGYLSTGEIDFNTDQTAKFEDFENCGFALHAEFEPVNGSASPQIVEVTHENLLQVNYEMASLNPQTIYKLRIVAEREVTASQLASEEYEFCQIGNQQALNDFLENNGLTTDLSNFEGPNNTVNLGPAFTDISTTVNTIENPFGSNEESFVHRKVLYTIYFRTSKFATPQEKLNSMSVEDVNIVPQTYYNWPSLNIIKNVKVSINCAEGFDKYDIIGHDYQASETMEYFRPYGPACNTEGMESTVQSWYNSTCSELFSYGSDPNGNGGFSMGESSDPFIQAAQAAQEMADAQPQLWKIDYKSDPSNYTGIKYIKPLLSNVEVGLEEPENTGVFTPYLFGFTEEEEDNTSSSSSSSSNVYGGFGISSSNNSTPYSMEGMQDEQSTNTGVGLMNFSSEPKLELLFKPDRIAYNMRNFLESGIYNIQDGNHIRPPAGNYPISISLSNTNFDANESAQPATNKTFNIYIPF